MKIDFPSKSEIQDLTYLNELDSEDLTDRELWLLSEFGSGSE